MQRNQRPRQCRTNISCYPSTTYKRKGTKRRKPNQTQRPLQSKRRKTTINYNEENTTTTTDSDVQPQTALERLPESNTQQAKTTMQELPCTDKICSEELFSFPDTSDNDTDILNRMKKLHAWFKETHIRQETKKEPTNEDE